MSFWLTLFLLAVTFVASELLRPKPRIENARPQNFEAPTATQGRPVPLLWGRKKLAGPNVTWYGDYRQEPILEKIKTGLFSSKRVVRGFRTFVGLQFGLCRGDDTCRLRRIRVGEKTLWEGTLGDGAFVDINEPEFFGGDTNGNGGIVGRLRFHVGTRTQAPNAYLQQHQTLAGVTPRYSGTAYAVWEGGNVGNSPRLEPWEFEVERYPNGLGLSGSGKVGTSDLNLMNVLYELFTNDEWGYDYSATSIDVTNWQAAAATLLSEGNGFSMLLEQTTEGTTLMEEVERQADMITYLDHRTGKWKVNLARGGYDVMTLPELTPSKIRDVRDFSRGSWSETTNVVRVKFQQRGNDYNESYALAHDMANALMQGGGTVATPTLITAEEYYPGVSNEALANQIAWRSLRTLSYPLAKAEIAVTREFWDLVPGQVVAWTDAGRGFTRLPMRIQKIDYGELQRGYLVLSLVQDVFAFAAGAFAPPPNTGWTPPEDTLAAFASTEQLAFPAPRGFVTRDPEIPGLQDRVWATGRRQGNASSFLIRERHSSGTPTGSFTDAGEGFGFTLIGQLASGLAAGTAVPTTSVIVTPTPTAQAVLEAAFVDDPDLVDQGKNLINLVMVGTELMLVRSASLSGSDVSLNGVYRGVLDTGQQKHASGTKVFVLAAGGALSDSTFTETHNVDVKLLPRSQFDTVLESAATTISFNMDKRLRRPYPPASTTANDSGSPFPASNSLDYLASGAAETTGIKLTLLRRDYRLGDGAVDEVAGLLTDAETLYPDYPARNSTDHDVAVRNDPDGANTLLFTVTDVPARDASVLRLRVLRHTDGVVPTRMRVEVTSKHDEGADTNLASRHAMVYDFNTTSAALAGKHNFGARAANAASTAYTALATGTFNLVLSSAFTAGTVDYRLDGGSWVTEITAGNTTGAGFSVTSGQTIEVRHTSTDVSALKQINLNDPTPTFVAYGVFYT
jgi:hypothetical protein